MDIWEETSERFIAVINIMGLRDFILKKDHKTVKNQIEIVQQITVNSVENIRGPKNADHNIQDIIKFAFYSDSIFIVSKDNSELSLQSLLLSCQVLMASFVFERLPVRGALSYGTITADFENSLFFGKSLIGCSNFLEDMYMYGIFLDSKVEKKSRELTGNIIDSYCFCEKTPTKSGLIRYYSVNWMKMATQISHLRPDQLLYNFYEEISGPNRKYLDNTLEFYEQLSEEIKSNILSTVKS